jgi:hypothetical protein
MAALLFGHDQAVADWVAQQAKGKPFHAPFTAFGLLDHEGRLVGGYVFTGFNGNSIEMSAAGQATVSRGGIAAVVQYVFGQLGCSRLQMHVSRRKKELLRMLAPRRGGKPLFKYEGVARRFYGKDDAVCYALTIDDLAEFQSRWRLT